MKNGEKELIKTTLNFTKDIDGFYFEYYIYYSIELSADLTSISYSYSIGKAASSEGKINILGGVIRNDFSFGTSSGTLTIWFSEKLIFEQTADF